EFLLERRNVANILGSQNSLSAGEQVYTVIGRNGLPERKSYIDGYQDNQQDVLMGAFYRTYTGRNIKNYSTRNIFPKVPLPNWMVTWDGLGKEPAFKKHFMSITIRHTY